MQFHNRKKDNPDMVEPYSKGAYGKIYRIAYFIANYMAGEKDKKPEIEPKENKKNRNVQRGWKNFVSVIHSYMIND